MKRDNGKTNYTGLTILFGLLTAFYTMIVLDKCEQEITNNTNANDKHNIIEEIESQHGYKRQLIIQIKLLNQYS